MRKLFFAFIKDHIRHICLYLGFAGIFYVVLSLYRVPSYAVNYAFLLSCVLFLLYGAVAFARYVRRREELFRAGQKMKYGIAELPPPASSVESDYQRILGEVWEDKREFESQERIARQELKDYYTMWVHQVKTPIAALGVLLQANEESGEESVRELVRDMKVELFKVEQYAEMVLTYLRMEGMSADLAFEVYALDDIIRQAVRKYAQMFILRKIRLDYRPTGARVLTDEKWLSFVIEQVLSNALKYTKQGSVSVFMENGELVIADTGIGIQAEDVPRVFERGFTGYNGRQDKKSTGIGLYLCRTVMDKLGHRIWLTSEPGEGTRVYMDLERRSGVR